MLYNIKIISIALSFLFVVYLLAQMFVPTNIGTDAIEVEIPEGASFREAMDILQGKNLIRDKNIFIILGRLTGMDRKIRAGYYAFWGYMSPYQVYKRFSEGRIIEFEVTINEGDSLLEIKQKLASKKIITQEIFDRLSTDKDFLKSLNIDAPSLEGYLYPDTYKFPKGAKASNVIKIMVNRLRQQYTDDLKERMREIGWNENEVLTLASIIEREAVVEKERAIISGVYHNRLKAGMPLQADPTAVYGIKSYKEKIYRKDLLRPTAYNTYIVKGLPPGPIASPSIQSIRAALYPANIPYYYFVSRNDGTHIFSKTLAEHNRAIRLVQGG
ncbi:MAG: endolytic transglycosylase MltG [Thermodesulfovibrionales bacterium]|nr:endolytic transglycosylase MltG [Thermodesulfovibrionales bacterium]